MWSVENIKDLSNKRIIITGANSGIGYEATKIFASKGAEVIMACRSLERGQQAFDTIKQELPEAKLVVLPLDLSSFESIRSFASQFTTKYKSLDILLNNAGIMMTPYGLTVDGLEQQQGVNHFGHFLLTSLLFDSLKKGSDARIVNISSIAHRFGKINFDNLMYDNKKGYKPFLAYGRSKLENLLFTYELSRRIQQRGLPIKVFAAHPGISSTNLGHYIYSRGIYKVFNALSRSWTQSAYMGSLPGVMAATDEDAVSGSFYGPNKLFGVRGNPYVCRSTKRSKNQALQQKLWDVSEQLTNTTFTI